MDDLVDEIMEGVGVVEEWADKTEEEMEESVNNMSKVVLIAVMVDTPTIRDIGTIIISH